MEILLKNNLTGNKELFKPVKKGHISMYNCGPTVYSEQHIGNLRAYIFADLLRRNFEFNGYKVKQVINITDVGHLVSDSDTGEDKMEKALRENLEKSGEILRASDIAEKYTNIFLDDLKKLDIDIKKIKFPRASDHIKEQINLIKILEKKGFAYTISDGVYFDTEKYPKYGKLGRIDLSGLKEGARVLTNSEKKHHTDFALWKFSKPKENRQQEWKSPWGIGYPGWHIECSAMSVKYLGQPFDIHTGGIDHIPIHHNNEIAQSEAANDKPQANYWLHVGHVTLDNEKISKSTGHVVYLRELTERSINPLSYRYWLLNAHYSHTINFSFSTLESAEIAYEKLLRKFAEENEIILNKDKIPADIYKKYINEFRLKLNDDLNTAESLVVLWRMLKDKNISISMKYSILLEMDKVLGLDIENQIRKFRNKIQSQKVETSKVSEEIQNLLDQRNIARKNKNFDEADAIRNKLSNLGYKIIDKDDVSIVELK